MKEVTLILPHQLFEEHPSLRKNRMVVLVEDPLFFLQYPFHAQKLIYHRATMKAFASSLVDKGYQVDYLDAHDAKALTEQLMGHLKRMGVDSLFMADPVDYMVMRRIKRYANRMSIRLEICDSPNFHVSTAYIQNYFKGKKRFFLTSFYIDERKRHHALLDADGNPLGGQWTFDTENRKRMPANEVAPELLDFSSNKEYLDAVEYVQSNFPNAPGVVKAPQFPITHDDAKDWLKRFCSERLKKFGDYQDAIQNGQRYLYHSVLTPMLNLGLLSPKEIWSEATRVGSELQIPLNNIEGFVRQVMGWREYIRAVYELKGVEERKRHFWNHHRPIPASFWNGTTGIPPLDDMIKGVNETAYAHHIERLMIAGNFMLLCEFDADEVYKWFMSLFIDAYDWVMVPNVYGMSQFADGGIMSTKPYISGSNYILKMSHYKRGEWCDIWDGLFWRFIDKHRDFFERNPRSIMMVRNLEKMDGAKRIALLGKANTFLDQLDHVR
jgi:deoxyribodipyrimidine photolyase-related protein